jgi:gliding motility-associated protein GldM|tara:strand:- start:1314 stop:2927 length:1614 start_codon:yes stop_codon:yes gene_type:complete
MAGKESPRQKMINMMYLIFIAMLALNLSKQILQSFGTMNEELTDTNVELVERNEQFMQGLEEKAREQAEKYLDLKLKADSIREVSTGLYNYLESIKEGAYVSAESKGINRNNYSKLDNTAYYTTLFFDGEEYKEDGRKFLDQMNNFRNSFVEIASSDPKLVSIAEEVSTKFDTGDVQVDDGKPRRYLDYHYKEMPLIVGITKISLLQSTLQNIEAQLLSTMLEGKLKIEASLTNFDAIVIPDKSSFFAGENFTGRIILGKNDPTLKADRVIINGNELDEESMQQGQTLLSFPAGGVGTKNIEGEFQFTEEGELISIPVTTSYEVVPKPNKATISADKMNVVYNGVSNPFTISFPGIDANKVSVNTPGLKKGKTIIDKGRKKKLTGSSDYELDLSELPPQLRGKKQVIINVTGTLPSGQKVTSKIPFRIKSLPVPYGTLDRTKPKSLKKSELTSSTVTATFGEDFDFDLPLRVRGFKITVAGVGSQVVSGNELDGQAKSLVQRARNNTIVTITDIQTRAIGSTTEIKEATDISFIIVN